MCHQNKPYIVMLMFVLTIFVTTGCATIFHGTSDQLKINSNPQGAVVTVTSESKWGGLKILVDSEGKHNSVVSETPCVLQVNKDMGRPSLIITIQKHGYQPISYSIESKWDAFWVGNLGLGVIGGLIGLSIDCLLGTTYRLERTEIFTDLIPIEEKKGENEK